MKARRMWQTGVNGGADEVMFGVWLPPGSGVFGINGFCGIEAETVTIVNRVLVGSVEGWVFNVDDIDSLGTMNAEFDKHVPKDTGTASLDLDVAGADTAPFYEPGKITWEFLFPIGRQPHRVFQKKWMSYMGHNTAIQNQDPETPFGFQFIGGLTFPLSSRPVRVEDPSLLVFAIASPLTTSTSSTEAIRAITEVEWGQLRYIDHVLERAMLSLIGLTEAGAETPWDEATLLLEDILDPPVFETGAGSFEQVRWRTYGEVSIDISVEGTMPENALDTGR